MKTEDDLDSIGYYVASADKTGAISPNEKFHPQFLGMHTATSFNLRLNSMYYGIYKAADSLTDALIKHFKETYDSKLTFNDSRKEKNETAELLFSEIIKMNKSILPNEVKEKIPVPRMVNRGKNKFLLFEKKNVSFTKSKVHFMLRMPLADGFSRSWGILYTKGS